MFLMLTPGLDEIVWYETGSDVAAPWEGTRSSLHGDLPALETHARHGLIHLEISGDSVTIGGASRVGLVVLPTGRRLIIRSKVSGLTILEWLVYLGEFRPLEHWLPEEGLAAQATEQDDGHLCIARLFLFAMEDVTRWHLRKDYAAIEIDELQIPGRIFATKLARRIWRLPCLPQARRSRTFDVPFNMILAKALDRVLVLLVGGRTDDRQ